MWRKTDAMNIIGTVLFLALGLFPVLSLTSDDSESTVENSIRELTSDSSAEHQEQDVPECCCSAGSDDIINKHFLLVSTMDGNMTALDVKENGKVMWAVDVDNESLLSGSLSSKKIIADGVPYILIPSLDGSLYMFNAKKNSLSSIPLSANIRLAMGDVEIAGGTFVTSTGIDPYTGKIRYRCTAGKCVKYDAPTNCSSPYTLIMRKNKQIARAVDPFTGAEKWNISVGEYDISLVSSDRTFPERRDAPTHVRFVLEPPKGGILAYDNCGNLKWEKRLSSPIAKVWQLSQGVIFEVSLFSSDTVTALNQFSGSAQPFIPMNGIPLYFGTVNSEPYIIPSKRLRESRYATTGQKYAHPQTAKLSHDDVVPFLDDLKVGDLIRRTYRASSASDSDTLKPSTCNIDDAVTIPGCRKLDVTFGADKVQDDRGWYIFKPSLKGCSKTNPFQGSDQNKGRDHHCDGNSDKMKQTTETRTILWLALEHVSFFFAVFWITTFAVIHYRLHHLIISLIWDNLKKRIQSIGKRANRTCSSHETRTNQTAPSATVHHVQDSFTSKFLEDFVPEKWLGRGGYGVVFNCRNRLDDRSYAVKRIAVINRDAAIERVKREARAMARLDHPGIIRYFHTWLERPPLGWQEVKDKEIMENLNFTCSESSFLPTGSDNEVKLNRSKSVCGVKNTSLIALKSGPAISSTNKRGSIVTNGSTNLSWMDDENDNRAGGLVKSGSSWTKSGNECTGNSPVAIAKKSDGSSRIVFANNDENSIFYSAESKNMRAENHSPPTPLEPPIVLYNTEENVKKNEKPKDCVYLYIQMELCQEFTLHNWLVANNNIKSRKISRMRKWFAELACAIDYIHSQGLIHRDLKPQNIFFSVGNNLKIGDLGLATNYARINETAACKPDTKENVHTRNVGTRLYMSPEQLKGEPYNEKIDVFSLGLVFVELIVPFKTVMERHAILFGLQEGIIPAHLDYRPAERKFVAWLTAPNPKDRPSARQVAECKYLRNEVRMLGSLYLRELPVKENH